MNTFTNRHTFVCSAVFCFMCVATLATTAVAATPPADNKYILHEQPEGAADVTAVREVAKNGEAVVIVGRIGGSRNPWIDGVAAFSLVDRSLTPCNEMEGDTCKTPWDYCCESELSKNVVLIKFVDENGRLLRSDARELLKVKELQSVVIQGKALHDEEGNVSIAATGIYVVANDDEQTP